MRNWLASQPAGQKLETKLKKLEFPEDRFLQSYLDRHPEVWGIEQHGKLLKSRYVLTLESATSFWRHLVCCFRRS